MPHNVIIPKESVEHVRERKSVRPATGGARHAGEAVAIAGGAIVLSLGISAVQKLAVGVSLEPRNFAGAALIGLVLGTLLAARIVALRRHLDAARRDRESLEALLDALPEGVAFQEAGGGEATAPHATSAESVYCYESRAGRSERCDSCIVRDAIESGSIRTGEVDLAGDGVHRVVAVPYGGQPGETQRAIVSFVSLARERRERKRLEGELAARELLLREVHHRMKNNLQLVASLISLQSSSHDGDDGAFGRLQGRVRTMALVHEQLHRRDDIEHVHVGEFLTSVITGVVGSMVPSGVTLTPQLELLDEEIRMEQAAPLGLIINELATNSTEHAFPGRSAGVVSLTMRRDGEELVLDYGDDGIGISEEARAHLQAGGGSMGMQLVSALSRQLGGNLDLHAGADGFGATLRFPSPRTVPTGVA